MPRNPDNLPITHFRYARRHPDRFIAAGLFLMAFGIRLVYALQITWPPLDDPAYYIQVARSLYYHHNLDVSIIWNFNPLFPQVTHPGLEFWQPLTSFCIFLSFCLFGDNFLAAQLPGLLAGSLLVIVPLFFARLLKLDRANAVGGLAGLLLAVNPLLAYQSVLPDSSMLFALPVSLAVLVLTRGYPGGLRPPHAFLFGLLAGLAYLARTPALFLVLVWLLFLLPRLIKKSQDRKEPFKELLAGLVGFGLPAGLWSLRNFLEFGFFTSPAGAQTIFQFDYDSLFNYSSPVSFGNWLEGGFGKILGIRFEALLSAWSGVLDNMFVPSVIPAVAGLLFLQHRNHSARPSALYALLLFLGLPLIFGVASIHGSFYHSAGSLAPFLALGLVFGIDSLAGWLGSKFKIAQRYINSGLCGIFLLVSMVWLGSYVPETVQRHRDEADLYNRISQWLNEHPAGVVVTNQPASLNYASGVAAVRFPVKEDLQTLLEVAQRYHAEQVIVTEVSGLYPDLFDTPQNKNFPELYHSPGWDFVVYKVAGS